ncbi:hypothetical protein Hanom_Chr02g00102831 [Helianthus anomalus]
MVPTSSLQKECQNLGTNLHDEITSICCKSGIAVTFIPGRNPTVNMILLLFPCISTFGLKTLYAGLAIGNLIGGACGGELGTIKDAIANEIPKAADASGGGERGCRKSTDDVVKKVFAD